MTTFPGSPRLVKGGLVLLDAESGAVQRTLTLQYNPESLSRSFQIQATGGEGNRSEAMRIKGPAVESFKLEAVIDATDHLEENEDTARELGIHPQLAALESLVHPTSDQLLANDRLARAGTLEIVPMETPLALFVWSKQRIVPVRVTSLSITEEAFDPRLNPIRAKVSLDLRVLSVDDLGFDHKGGSLFVSYLQQKENLASKGPRGSLGTLGVDEIR